jgi:N-acetylmuramoyl-L-alanine amidase
VYLRKAGFQVKNADYGSMYTRVAESNSWGADLHVAIHTNATRNHTVTGGTQIYLNELDGEHKKVGTAVLNRLAPLTPGKNAEGLKKNPGFYEINKANAITVYIEVEFHDTKTGADYIRNHTTEIGEAIAKGLCNYYGVALPTEKKPEKESRALYCIQVGAYSDYANANRKLEEVKSKGFTDAFITIKKQSV